MRFLISYFNKCSYYLVSVNSAKEYKITIISNPQFSILESTHPELFKIEL